MNKKILILRFLCLSLLILIIIFLSIKIYKNEIGFIRNILLSILNSLSYIFILVGLHELSHALIAWIFKFHVANIKILFLEFDLANKQFRININNDLGYCKAYPTQNNKYTIYAYIFHIAMGPIMNLLISVYIIFHIVNGDHKTLSDLLLLLISSYVLLEYIFFIPSKNATDFSDLQMIYLIIKKDRRAIHFYETSLFMGLNSIGIRPKDYPVRQLDSDIQHINSCEIPYYLYLSYHYFDKGEYKKAYEIITLLKVKYQINNSELLSFEFLLSKLIGNKNMKDWISNDFKILDNSIEVLIANFYIQNNIEEKKVIAQKIEEYFKSNNDGFDKMFYNFISKDLYKFKNI